MATAFNCALLRAAPCVMGGTGGHAMRGAAFVTVRFTDAVAVALVFVSAGVKAVERGCSPAFRIVPAGVV